VYSCAGKPVYQKGGSGGLVLVQPDTDTDTDTDWTVSSSDHATSCAASGILASYTNNIGGVCPESPDGAGCAGKWRQLTRNCGAGSTWCNAPNVVVEATAARNCTGSPCGPHATACDAYGADEHVCVCELGWYGAACETQMAAAFTLSGNSGSPDLNGRYTKTTHVCGSKPVYQKGGSDGVVLFRPDGDASWTVSTSGDATDCKTGGYLSTNGNGGVCPESPDGAGCAGKWRAHYTDGWRNKPTIAVVAN
jgi:hypothetical protein